MIKLALVSTLLACMYSCHASPPAPPPSPTRIVLAWKASTPGCCVPSPIVIYTVERSVHGKNLFSTLNPAGTTALSYTDTTPVDNVEYDYRVQASDANGIAMSIVLTVTLP
jgi:hypothetical protein